MAEAVAPNGSGEVRAAREVSAARVDGSRPRGFRPPGWLHPVVVVAALVPFGWVCWAFYSDLVNNTRLLTSEPIKEAEHFTGKWALRYLLTCLAVTPIMRLAKVGWLVKYRRTFGLLAFFYAVVHLGIYFGLDIELMWSNLVEDVAERLYITLGMLGLLLMVPLAVTSTKGWIRRMGNRRWTALHRLVYVSAVLGCIHFYMAVKRDVTEPLIFMGILALSLGLRWRWSRAGR
ncbi:MAG: sulfoxide reductase heme-binding subunit YedZ [Gemmatimonadetes bacterium]|nr:sulfoxide reductase heme-binding subunit YedZ [Gemmatimonadota bacterium]